MLKVLLAFMILMSLGHIQAERESYQVVSVKQLSWSPLVQVKYRQFSLYYPILDTFLMELNRRFSERNVDIMRAILACSPQCACFLGLAQLQPLIDCYSLDCESLRMESVIAKRTLAEETIESIADIFQELSLLREAYKLPLQSVWLLNPVRGHSLLWNESKHI